MFETAHYRVTATSDRLDPLRSASIPKMERYMSGRNLESFLEDADAFAALSEDDKARLFAGDALEGETSTPEPELKEEGAKESSEPPAAAATDDTKKDTATAEPVILIKDGSHTIPFSVLEAERQRVRELEQQLQATQEAVKEPPKVTPSEPVKPAASGELDADLKALFAERDEAFYSGEAEKAAELNAKIFAIQQERATQAAVERIEARNAERKAEEDRVKTVSEIESRVASAVEKYPFLDYKGPQANKDAIDLVVAQRDLLIARGVPAPDAIDQAIAKVAPLFVKETIDQKADAAAKAAEVIKEAKNPVPTSLSSVPAGASVHHDEGEAIRNRSGLSLLNSFEGKSADDILKLMSRVI